MSDDNHTTTPTHHLGTAVGELINQLADHQRTHLPPGKRVAAIASAIVATPLIWPLDDRLAEILLQIAGFDLDRPDERSLASLVVSAVQSTAWSPIVCGHGPERGRLCVLEQIPDTGQLFPGGMAQTTLLARRSRQATELAVLAELPDGAAMDRVRRKGRTSDN